MESKAACQHFFRMGYNSRHEQNQITSLLFFSHDRTACLAGSFRPGRKIIGSECASRVFAWSLGTGRGSRFYRRRSRWTFGTTLAKRNFSRLVSRPWPHGHHLLADLSSTLLICHASELEWLISCRAALSSCHHFCGDRRFTPAWFLAFQYLMAHFLWKYPLHRHIASGLCNRTKCDAPAAIPHF